jgi:thymidylate synthase
MQMLPHPEYQYINLIKEVIEKGCDEETRNGITRSIFGYSMRFSLREGELPLITTKKLAWKTCLKELFWFIRGQTDNKILQQEGVHIWDGNTSREYLDSIGFNTREEGDIGPGYGHQWRHFNASYTDCKTDYTNQGIDQLQDIINQLKNPTKNNSRRLIMTAWNPCQIPEMSLPPCHLLVQFNVRQGKYLSTALYQRSGDIGLGVPFNIASYSFLTHILAKHCGLEPEEFVYFLGNAHIYQEHLETLKEQIEREPFTFPKIKVINTHENIDDYCLEDLVFTEEYKYHSTLKMQLK